MAYALFAIVAWLACAGAALAADQPGRLHPLMSAIEILRLRDGGAPAPELQLTYAYTYGTSPPQSVVIGIGWDYAYKQHEDVTTILDFRLGRLITVRQAGRDFHNYAQHAFVGFREGQLGKRFVRSWDPMWLESEFGMTSPRWQRPTIERRGLPDEGMAFDYQGETWTSFKPARLATNVAEVARFYKVLRFEVAIHPGVYSELVATGRFPETLAFQRTPLTGKVAVSYRLADARRVAARYPLPLDFAAAPPQPFEPASASLIANVVSVAPQVLAETHGGGARSPEHYRRAIDNGYQRADLGVALTYMELGLHYGSGAMECPAPSAAARRCRSLKDVMERALARDKKVQVYVDATGLQGRDPAKAVEMWKSIRTSNLASGHVLDIFMANIASAGERRTEAEALFSSAFSANPYLTSIYKDIGDHFFRNYDTLSAWFFYEVGRAIPSRSRVDTFDVVDAYERELMADHPEYY
jgi:hypothetical protein